MMNNTNNDGAYNNQLESLPFSQACENNKDAILAVLKKELVGHSYVLEVGSGTGQHSVYFAPRLKHLEWQTSDVMENHRLIQAWHQAYPTPNLHAPVAFDLTTDSLPTLKSNQPFDAVFTANTLHIIAWSLVERLFEMVGESLPIDGKLIVYGPFNENGQYTSASNRSFDFSLKQRDPNSGIRNKEDIIAIAKLHQLVLANEYPMPANNQILVFQKINSL